MTTDGPTPAAPASDNFTDGRYVVSVTDVFGDRDPIAITSQVKVMRESFERLGPQSALILAVVADGEQDAAVGRITAALSSAEASDRNPSSPAFASRPTGWEEAVERLVNLAALAVCEPRRFHENEGGIQQELSYAITRVRLLRAAGFSPGPEDERLRAALLALVR